MKKSFYLVHFKKRVIDSILLGGARANELIEKAKYRIRVKRLLDSCPDERTRRQMMARLAAEERRVEIYNARLKNYQKMISVGFLDMIEALIMVYSDQTEEDLTEEQMAQAKELFRNGKAKLVMYSRWLDTINPNTCAKEWADAIEPLELDSFCSSKAWLKFFNNLPIN